MTCNEHFKNITPNLKIENLKVSQGQKRFFPFFHFGKFGNCNCNQIAIAIWIAIAIAFSICGLMWSGKTFIFVIFIFQISIFKFQFWCHTNTKFENWKLKVENLKVVPDQKWDFCFASFIFGHGKIAIAIWIPTAIVFSSAIAFAFPICGLMWSGNTLKLSIFNFQLWSHTNTKFENWKLFGSQVHFWLQLKLRFDLKTQLELQLQFWLQLHEKITKKSQKKTQTNIMKKKLRKKTWKTKSLPKKMTKNENARKMKMHEKWVNNQKWKKWRKTKSRKIEKVEKWKCTKNWKWTKRQHEHSNHGKMAKKKKEKWKWQGKNEK